MACDPSELLSTGSCFSCLGEDQLEAIQTELLCRIYESSAGGGPITTSELTLTGFDEGSVLFVGAGGVVSEDNPNFNYFPSSSTGATIQPGNGFSGALNLLGGAAPAAAGTGGAVTIQGGAGATDPAGSNGGGVIITGGAAGGDGTTPRAGGAITITGGTPVGTTAGGSITITGGPGNSVGSGSAGGVLNLRGGAAGGDGTVARNGGAVAILAGLAVGSGTGGSITATAGAGSNVGSGGPGGNITLTTGSAGGDDTVSRAGGFFVFQGGSAKGSAAGGPMTFQGGVGGVGTAGTGGSGGALTFIGGVGGLGSSTGGVGGAIAFRGGLGGASGTPGAGGNITFSVAATTTLVEKVRITATTGNLQLANDLTFGATVAAPDIYLTRDAAAILALRNASVAQTFRVYGIFTDASNYNRLAISGNAIVSESAGTGATASPFRITTSQPILNLAQDWNAGGVTFTALKLNVTDTASAAASLLLDLQVGAATKFNVNKAGDVQILGAINHDGTTAGFFGVAPATQPTAYTQTYAVANKTIANPAATALTSFGVSANNTLVDVATAGIADPAKVNANFDDVALQVNNLIADVLDLKQAVNAIIDDLQSLGIVQ